MKHNVFFILFHLYWYIVARRGHYSTRCSAHKKNHQSVHLYSLALPLGSRDKTFHTQMLQFPKRPLEHWGHSKDCGERPQELQQLFFFDCVCSIDKRKTDGGTEKEETNRICGRGSGFSVAWCRSCRNAKRQLSVSDARK